MMRFTDVIIKQFIVKRKVSLPVGLAMDIMIGTPHIVP